MVPDAQRRQSSSYGSVPYVNSFFNPEEDDFQITEAKDWTQCLCVCFFLLEALEFASVCALLSEAKQRRYTPTLFNLLIATVVVGGLGLLASLPSKHTAVCRRETAINPDPPRDPFVTGKVLLFTGLTAPLFSISLAILVLFHHAFHTTFQLVPVICAVIFTSLDFMLFAFFCYYRDVCMSSLTTVFISCALICGLINGMIYFFLVDAKNAGRVMGCLVLGGVFLSLCNHFAQRRRSKYDEEDSRESY